MSQDNNTSGVFKKLLFWGLVIIGTNTEKLFFYNEEVVVAFCFVAFMIFSFQFIGKSIAASLDERQDAIHTGIYSCIDTEEAYCDQFFSDVDSFLKVSPSLASCLALILLKKEWYSYLRHEYKRLAFAHSITKMFGFRIGQQVQELKLLTTSFKDQWLNSAANKYQTATLLECQKTWQKELTKTQL